MELTAEMSDDQYTGAKGKTILHRVRHIYSQPTMKVLPLKPFYSWYEHSLYIKSACSHNTD